jgi:hypothetical protein
MTPFYVWLRNGDPPLWAKVVESGYAADEEFLRRETDRLNVLIFFNHQRGVSRDRVLAAWRNYVRETQASP